MAFSTQRVTSDGTLVLLDISIEYFDRSEIAVLFDGVVDVYPWAWVGTTEKKISFTPAVPDTVEVMLVRTTDLSAVRHIFTLGAKFTTQSVDEDLTQILHIAQEARENATIEEVFHNLNMHGYRIVSLGDGVDPQDAATVSQMVVHDAQIVAYKDAAQASAVAAAASAAAALVSELAATAATVTTVNSGGTVAVLMTSATGAAKLPAGSTAQRPSPVQGMLRFNSDLGTWEGYSGTAWDELTKASPDVNDFRLSLTSGTPITTTDVTAASTLYCTPYTGNQLSLYNGTAWVQRSASEFSIALTGLTSAKPYDVFCYDNVGTPTLEVLAWSNDTTRATALAYQDGILCKAGALTRRYLGTFYTTSTTTTEDSAANRYLWNYYHRVVRLMKRRDATASWNYTTATWRQANGSTANQLNFVVGLAEDAITAKLAVGVTSTVASAAYIAIGLDTVVAPTEVQGGGPIAGTSVIYNADLAVLPTAGKHYLAWLEYSLALGTTTWASAGASGAVLHGEVLA